MSNKIQLKRDTEENWTNNNPVLAAGELALTTDTDPPKLKVGDGSTAWSSLTYITSTGGGGGGGVTSVALSSSDLTISGSPITSSGNITANLATQGSVTPAMYGDASTVPVVTVNSKGIVTAITDESIALPINQINASGTPSSATFLRGDGAWATPTAASEWTRVVLGSDFSTTNATNTNITGLSFTPTASRVYYIEVYLLLRTGTNTVGARPGIAFPSSLLDSGAWMQAPNSATASAQRWWGTTATANAASTGLGNTTSSWMAIGGAMLVCGPSTSGNFQITLASETAGTAVTAKQYSFLRYREI